VSKLIDITGQVFGKLTVMHRVKNRMAGCTNHQEIWYRVRCECGKVTSMRGYLIRDGRARSCGCVKGNLRHGLVGTLEYTMWCSAKSSSKKRHLPFNIEPKDIVIPKICPLLGVPLQVGKKKHCPNSPSLDKIIPSQGYVKGNIQVVSYRANVIKQDASLQELQTLTANLERILS
jgi:hypothetical protein